MSIDLHCNYYNYYRVIPSEVHVSIHVPPCNLVSSMILGCHKVSQDFKNNFARIMQDIFSRVQSVYSDCDDSYQSYNRKEHAGNYWSEP